MEERKEVLIVCLILLAIAAIFFFLTVFYSKFNFYKEKGKCPLKGEESEEAFKAITPFKHVWDFKITGGWVKNEE